VGELPHRVLAVSRKYVDIACGLADYPDVAALAIDETSHAMSHSYAPGALTPMPDAGPSSDFMHAVLYESRALNPPCQYDLRHLPLSN